MSNRKQKTILQDEKMRFCPINTLLFSMDTEPGYLKEYLRLCKTNTISLHP